MGDERGAVEGEKILFWGQLEGAWRQEERRDGVKDAIRSIDIALANGRTGDCVPCRLELDVEVIAFNGSDYGIRNEAGVG